MRWPRRAVSQTMNMLGLKTRVGQRFLTILLVISLLPLAVVGWLATRTAESTLSRQTLSTLRAASDGVEAQLREFLRSFSDRMRVLSQDENISQLLKTPTASGSAIPSSFSGLHKFLSEQRRRIPDVEEIFVIAPDGDVVESSARSIVTGNVGNSEYFIRGRQGFFAGDIYRALDGRVTWVMASPIYHAATQRLLGVLAFRVDPELLSDLTTGRRVLAEGANSQSFRIGETGESYIVNRKRFMVSESRYISNAVLNVKIDTLPVRVALDRGEEITANYKDYRGIEVSGASIILRNVGWIVITEVDFRQVFAPIRRLRNGLFAASGGMALLVMGLAWSSTRRIIRPIRLLTEADRAFARADRSAAEVPEEDLPQDELGDFVRQRNARVKAVFAYQQQLEQRTAKLKEAITELEHISYSMMHDMRAPLRALTGFGGIILDEEAHRLSDRGREYLDRIRAAAMRMDQFICDVLNYSRIARAEIPLHPVNVAEIVSEIVDSYPALQKFKGQIDVQQDMPAVQGNEAALTQCLANLLDNAVKFVAPGQIPHVRIRGESINGRLRVWVEDNGVGIPQTMRERIFEIFERGSNLGNSTGIGLAIVRKSIERMGGSVGVISEEGRGSRFWFELPRAG